MIIIILYPEKMTGSLGRPKCLLGLLPEEPHQAYTQPLLIEPKGEPA